MTNSSAASWCETRPLSSVASIERKGIAPANIQTGTLFVGLEHVCTDGSFSNVSPVENGALASTKFEFSSEHILYGKLRPYLSKIARPDFEGVCSTDILPIKPGPEINRDFLFFYLRQPEMIELAVRRSSGANLPRLSPNHLGEFPIRFPDIPEQERIAAILDQANAIRRTRQHATQISGTVIPSVFKEMFGNPVQNEKEWPTVRVAEAGEVLLGRQRAPKYQTGEYTTPYMRVANVFEDRIDATDVLSMDFNPSDFARYKLEDGDILLNEGQSTELVGRPAIWRNEIPNCCFQNTLVRFRADGETTHPEYALNVFLFYLHSGEFAKISSKTSNVAHLGAGRFSQMPFPLPPIELQREFAERVAATRAIRTTYREASDECADLFESLIHRAFRGEL